MQGFLAEVFDFFVILDDIVLIAMLLLILLICRDAIRVLFFFQWNRQRVIRKWQREHTWMIINRRD